MEKIEFTTDVKVGDDNISDIQVKPLTFLELTKLWKLANAAAKPEVQLQRERIKHQAHFFDGPTRRIPDDIQLGVMPFGVMKSIIATLEIGQGTMGSVVGKGDGVTAPAMWKLGTPIEMKDGKGDKTTITELEFHATKFSEVEDILAADGEIEQALLLLMNLATPVGVSGLMRLPGWALDRITVADGIGVMRSILPRF